MPKPRGVHLWTILLVLLVVTAAGGVYALTRDGDEGAKHALTVTVKANQAAEPVVAELDCEDIDTGPLCDKLTDKLLAPVPAKQACSMIFGGDQTATITGTLRGEKVDSSFSRANGCEIARWDELSAALKPAAIKGL